jgi:FlaA1/EpsC-like NDP-sugar epimerase
MTRLRNRHLLIADLLLLPLAAYLSFLLRLESFDFATYGRGFILLAGLALLITPLVFRRAGVYSRYWRYASVEEMLLLAGAVTVAVVLAGGLSLVAVRLLPGHPPLPRSIPLIFLPLALAVTAGPRFAARLTARSARWNKNNGRSNGARPQPVLIMGAGDAGAMIVREMQNNPHLGLEPVGFLDDDLGKHDVKIHGVPVLGDRHAIPAAVKKHQVRQVIIAMPTAPGAAIRDIVRICKEAGVSARTIPGIYELLDGSVSVKQVRDVDIQDLLRREPVQTDIAAVRELLRGKRVLVTGGGGSIGSELCRQILCCEPARLIILGHGENSIFEISEELKPQAATLGVQLVSVIAGIRFAERMCVVFEEHRPQIVFHAAAHKHVPLMESNPGEAITNNVGGTRNLLDVAMASDVERFVMISTDKAVNPTSIMGASKRAAELLVHAAAVRTGRPYVAVRFGNVLGSRGSVVLTFKKQIAAGGPITVTHPEMRRYFMTIPEAVQLVLQAAALGRGGEVFVLDMGEPVKIADLARDLIELSGLQVGRDVGVIYTGLRPGEKLFEELFIPGEVYARTAHQKIFVANNGAGEQGSRGEGERWSGGAGERRRCADGEGRCADRGGGAG